MLGGVFDHEEGCRAPDYGPCSCSVRHTVNSKSALMQSLQQVAPHQVISPPAAEVTELQATARDWQRQFHQLESLVQSHGFTVGYGESGEVTLERVRRGTSYEMPLEDFISVSIEVKK